MKCRECGRTFLTGDLMIFGRDGHCCPDRRNCFERTKTMPNIKITAEVDGKQVPLDNISTETFEALRAFHITPKEIPAIAIGNYKSEPHCKRLFIKINDSIRDSIAKHNATMIVINPKNGQITNWWIGNGSNDREYYENIKPL